MKIFFIPLIALSISLMVACGEARPTYAPLPLPETEVIEILKEALRRQLIDPDMEGRYQIGHYQNGRVIPFNFNCLNFITGKLSGTNFAAGPPTVRMLTKEDLININVNPRRLDGIWEVTWPMKWPYDDRIGERVKTFTPDLGSSTPFKDLLLYANGGTQVELYKWLVFARVPSARLEPENRDSPGKIIYNMTGCP